VGGGGTAYRYGGEEFFVIFPGFSLRSRAHLEAVRKAFEGYRMAGARRGSPEETKEGESCGGDRRRSRPSEVLSVTISIAFAASDAPATRCRCSKAADEALYRAKQGGAIEWHARVSCLPDADSGHEIEITAACAPQGAGARTSQGVQRVALRFDVRRSSLPEWVQGPPAEPGDSRVTPRVTC